MYANGAPTECFACTNQAGCITPVAGECATDRPTQLKCSVPDAANKFALGGTNNEIVVPWQCAPYSFPAGLAPADVFPCVAGLILQVAAGSNSCNVKCAPGFRPDSGTSGTVVCNPAQNGDPATASGFVCLPGSEAPSVVSATFSNTGHMITILFDLASNEPGPGCADFLDAPSMALLGAAACSWMSATRYAPSSVSHLYSRCLIFVFFSFCL